MTLGCGSMEVVCDRDSRSRGMVVRTEARFDW